MSRLPLVEVPPAIAGRIKALGGKPLNLYRVLANNPGLLEAWVEFAYRLRAGNTPRSLRELMILRSAQMANSSYELAQHKPMAEKAGVTSLQIEQLRDWRDSNQFDNIEKAALELTEAVVNNAVTDSIYKAAAEYFSEADMVELLLTASFYCMVPRFLEAARVSTKDEIT